MERYTLPLGQEVIFPESREKKDAASVDFPLASSSLSSLNCIQIPAKDLLL